MSAEDHQYSNYSLRCLSEHDFALLAPFSEPVQMKKLLSLETSNSPITYIIFLESGIASSVARVNTREIEVGVTGREGVAGTAVLLGGNMAPLTATFS